MILTIILFILGVWILVKGAGWLVDGASRGAEIFKISPLVIGLSVVAIGTSLPEFAVSLTAVISGSGDISVGNIIGSNICNIGLALAIAAIISVVSVSKSTLKRDFPVMLGVTVLLLIFIANRRLERWEGILLFVSFICYFVYLSRRKEIFTQKEKSYPGWIRKYPWATILSGMIGIAVGARLMVNSGVQIAGFLGVSEAIIGLSMMAIGTSLPELVTSVVAMLHKESEMSLGNILGSNILNITLVLGCVSIIRPIDVSPRLFSIDGWIMLGYAIILFPLLLTQYKLSRKEGIFLLTTYIIYFIYLYLS
ncbi:calcium/sodium antiporter [candidate division WOR-3 bacterium]|nr:calcium/sodium antiporter [candidate division WOR-3 bacterium]